MVHATSSGSSTPSPQDLVSGVSRSLLTANDFIGVRAELVRQLGGDGNRALVLTRIFFRADERWREAHEVNGRWYWRATRDQIALETGLSADQVKRILAWLTAEGWIESESFQLEGTWDRTRSLRVIIDDGADAPDGRAESPNVGADLHRSIGAESPNPPLTEVKTFSGLETPGAFEEFWAAYPRKIYINNARFNWEEHVTQPGVDPQLVIQAARLYAAEVLQSQTEDRFVKAPAAWLLAGGWMNYQQPASPIDLQAERERAERARRRALTPEQRRAEDEAAIEAEYQRVAELTRTTPRTQHADD